MLDRLAELVVRRRLWIVVVTGLFFLAAGATGHGVSERLSSGGFEDPNAEALIRATLVPAFMRLGGRANWWMRRIHDRFGTSAAAPAPRGGTS